MFGLHRSGCLFPLRLNVRASSSGDEWTAVGEEMRSDSGFCFFFDEASGWQIQGVCRSTQALLGIDLQAMKAGAVSLSSYLSDICNVIATLRARDGAVITLHNVATPSLSGGGAATTMMTSQLARSKEKGFGSKQSVTAKLQTLRLPYLTSPLHILRFRRATAIDIQTSEAIARIEGEVQDDGGADSPRGLHDVTGGGRDARGGSNSDGSSSISGSVDDVTSHASSLQLADDQVLTSGRTDNVTHSDDGGSAERASADGQRRSHAAATTTIRHATLKRVAFSGQHQHQQQSQSEGQTSNSLLPSSMEGGADDVTQGGPGGSDEEVVEPTASYHRTPSSSSNGLRQRQQSSKRSVASASTSGGGSFNASSGARQSPSNSPPTSSSATAIHVLSGQTQPHHEALDVDTTTRKKTDGQSAPATAAFTIATSREHHHRHASIFEEDQHRIAYADVDGASVPAVVLHSPVVVNKAASIGSGSKTSASSAASLSEMVRRGIAFRSGKMDGSLLRLQRAVIVVFGLIAIIALVSVILSRQLFGELMTNFNLVHINGEKGTALQRAFGMVQLLWMTNRGLLVNDTAAVARYRDQLWGCLNVIEAGQLAMLERNDLIAAGRTLWYTPSTTVFDLVPGSYVDR